MRVGGSGRLVAGSCAGVDLASLQTLYAGEELVDMGIAVKMVTTTLVTVRDSEVRSSPVATAVRPLEQSGRVQGVGMEGLQKLLAGEGGAPVLDLGKFNPEPPRAQLPEALADAGLGELVTT